MSTSYNFISQNPSRHSHSHSFIRPISHKILSLAGVRSRKKVIEATTEMLKPKPFAGANVFVSRNLVAPEMFDALHDALKQNGAEVFLCCDPSRNGPNDYHVISSADHVWNVLLISSSIYIATSDWRCVYWLLIPAFRKSSRIFAPRDATC